MLLLSILLPADLHSSPFLSLSFPVSPAPVSAQTSQPPPYSWFVSLLSLWISFLLHHPSPLISLSFLPLFSYPQRVCVCVCVCVCEGERERERGDNVFSLSASLKPINGSLSGCAVLCSAAVCSRIQRQIGLSRVCLGWTQQGVAEGRLNKCVHLCVDGRIQATVCCWIHREGWREERVFVFVSIRQNVCVEHLMIYSVCVCLCVCVCFEWNWDRWCVCVRQGCNYR